jgi:hypothetical protein
MARKPVSVFRRPMTKKGQYRYYIQFWQADNIRYSVARSAASIASDLGLDPKEFPPTSRTGATLIGQEYLRRSGSIMRKSNPLFADFCAETWDWETSPYVRGKLERGQRIGREYVSHNAAYVANYIRPAFPTLRLSALIIRNRRRCDDGSAYRSSKALRFSSSGYVLRFSPMLSPSYSLGEA